MENKNPELATVRVPTKGGDPKENKEPQFTPGPNPELVDDKHTDGDLTQEDRELKERLELAVERLKDADANVVLMALELLRKEIREATSSMTSVPKPFKFLFPHVAAMRELYEKLPVSYNDTTRKAFADVLSVLSMTMGRPGRRDVLSYRLSGNLGDIGDWGSEYIRTLAAEIGAAYAALEEREGGEGAGGKEGEEGETREALIGLVKSIIPFDMRHNAEVDAVDLCLETDQLDLLLLPGMVDAASHSRVCLYLFKCADYAADVEEAERILLVSYQIYLAHQQYTDALRVALRLGGQDLHGRIKTVFDACADGGVRQQMGYMLGRHRALDYIAHDDAVDTLIGNSTISKLFAALAHDLDVVEAKTPEDIYKIHLSGAADRRGETAMAESAKGNLASTYVNAFVNAGYGQDKLVSKPDSRWIYKNREHGIMAAAASLGMINAWNETQLDVLDKYLEADDELARAGAILGLGLMTAGLRNLDVDPMQGLLSTHLEEGNRSTPNMKLAAILSLGMCYAGTNRSDIADIITPYVADASPTASFELAAIGAYALGMIFVGTSKEDVASLLADRLMVANEAEAGSAIARHLALGLGLLFLGRGEAASAIIEILGVVEHPVGEVAKMLVRACAYAGTGNVLIVQEFLRICAQHPEGEDQAKAEANHKEEQERAAKTRAAANIAARGTAAGPTGAPAAPAAGAATAPAAVETVGKYLHQSTAVLGLALVSMGEELSVDMGSRMADHLLQYGDTAVRRMVPLALALLHVGDPDYAIVDILSKLSHDPNEETAQAAIFGMGIAGAGTNNSRIAGLLRTLATFYKSDPNTLFVVRIAQGILHMGKGLITINPIHSDRSLLSPVCLAGLLSTLMLFLDVKASLHNSKWHMLLYSLAVSMHPRFAITVDEDGALLPVEVRVGLAVETVGQAGRPKTITGFQTHTTPVLMGVKDRAELADDAYIPLANVLENVIILRKNPDAKVNKKKPSAAAAKK